MTGKVYLVGAGPGDSKLITLRAVELLKKADVVLYDRLVSKKILSMIPKKAKKVYVGRAIGFIGMSSAAVAVESFSATVTTTCPKCGNKYSPSDDSRVCPVCG